MTLNPTERDRIYQTALQQGHTPGPWEVCDGAYMVIATNEQLKREREVKADLLAVAHSALARLVSVSDFRDPNSEASRLQVALRTAIAKAEGVAV